ncbi:hypothetical protein TNCV_5061711 [Trichonephila clavipes]|nr:hypothetical protein TNCV_5061711 [Trichonephila clavipes]
MSTVRSLALYGSVVSLRHGCSRPRVVNVRGDRYLCQQALCYRMSPTFSEHCRVIKKIDTPLNSLLTAASNSSVL